MSALAVDNNGIPILSHDVAFLKLEQKFNAAMGQIAALASEKEELEHVNIQLQEETETVGELKRDSVEGSEYFTRACRPPVGGSFLLLRIRSIWS